MLPHPEKSNIMAAASWMIAFGFLISVEPNIFVTYNRLLVFFTIIAFWYGLSLYIRRQKHVNPDGTIYYETLHYLGTIWAEWYMVLAFEIFLLPTTFVTLLGILYALTGKIIVEFSMITIIILWMFFFAFESTHSQGKMFSKFNFSELNWFVAFGVFLDVAGLIFSVIDIAS